MLEHRLGPILVPRRYGRFLVLGCCLGVAAVLVVLSLFSNYYRAVEEQLLGIHAHLSVHPPEGTLEAEDVKRLRRALEGVDGVVAARPAIDREVRLQIASVDQFSVACRDDGGVSLCWDALSQRDTGVRVAAGYELERARSLRVRLRGIDVGVRPPTLELERLLDVRGEDLDLDRLALGPPQGLPMAAYFQRQVFPGAVPLDSFLLRTRQPNSGDQGDVAQPEHHVRLLSTLNLGLRQGRHPVIVTSLENASRLLGGFAANAFEIRLAEPAMARSVAALVDERLGDRGLEVRTWLDQDQGALRLLGALRWVILVVASCVIGVAALGVMSTLSLVVIEGRRTISMLRAMGLRNRKIYATLALTSTRIAGLGVAGGTFAGLMASWALLSLPGFRRGLGKMGIADPQVMLGLMDLVPVALITWLLFLAVSWWPARQACHLHPVKGLQS